MRVSCYNLHGSRCYLVTIIHGPGYIIGLKCNQITLFIKFYLKIHHIYAVLHYKEVQMVYFITAVEINVHIIKFHHSTLNTKQVETTHKQKHNGAGIHIYTQKKKC